MGKKLWRAALITGLLLGFTDIGLAAEAESAPSANAREYGLWMLDNDGKGWDVSDLILGEDSAWDFGGWVSFGYSSNPDGLFNNHDQGFNNHQTWLYLEKALDTEDGFDWGFRFDAMYGLDADDTQAFGNSSGRWDFEQDSLTHGNYGYAFPQLYLELGYEDWSIKGGHFFTPVGYEVVTAPDNFFFTHALTMYNSEPFTHTGALVTYSGFENISVFGGWTAGWDTGFDRNDGGNNFLGGISYQPIEEATITYTLTGGDLGVIGSGYSHSIVIDTTPLARLGFLSDLNYVFQSDLLTTSDSVGVNQYLFYPLVDEIIVLGFRGEWWRTEEQDYGQVTGGVNLSILPNLKIRPEGRYQWAPSEVNNVAGLPSGKGIFSLDMILTF